MPDDTSDVSSAQNPGARRRRARPKDLGDGKRRCAYGECLAELTASGSLYCHPEHARLAKIRVTLEARAEAAYRRSLEDAVLRDRTTAAPTYRGWITTQAGLVLNGQDAIELKAAVTDLTAALRQAQAAATRGDSAAIREGIRALQVALGPLQDAIAALPRLGPRAPHTPRGRR